jgi:hypothetical protein
VPLSLGRSSWASVPFGGTFHVADLVGAIWIGFVLHHYCLDQRIWRLASDRRLNQDLRLTAP